MARPKAKHRETVRQLEREIRKAKRDGPAGEETKYCILVGGAGLVGELSPRMHMAAYRALRRIGRPVDLFYFQHGNDDLTGVMEAMRIPELRIKGASITVPHKHEVIKYLDVLDETAERVEAVNTVVRQGGKLRGYNTDVKGAREALLEKLPDINDSMNAIVIGAGGTARAMAYMLSRLGVKVMVYNRNPANAEAIASTLGLEFGRGLDALIGAPTADIIINTTKVGSQLAGMAGQSLVPMELLVRSEGAVVFDVIHTPLETQLIKQAQAVGLKVVTGDRMLLHGAEEQVQILTKRTGNGLVIRAMSEAMKSFYIAQREE